jgi:DNA ligase (NAD+)
MSKFIGKMFDKLLASHVVLHDAKTCPECGSKLAARRDELHESPSRSPEPDEVRDSCNSSFRDREEAWYCPNLDCPARLRERIEHWCSPGAMNIAIADKALVAQLLKRGLVRDVAELYSVRLSEVAALEGRDKEFAKAFLAQLASSKSQEGWRLLYGLGVPQVDAETARRLCSHFAAVDDVLAAGPERIVEQAGVTEPVARSIAHWYGDSVNQRLVRRLQKAGVNFRSEALSPPRSRPSSSER